MRSARFEDQFKRIQFVTETKTYAELAAFFNISQAAVSDVRRRGKIPADWLVILICAKGVHPEWVLQGHGPCAAMPLPGCYESGDSVRERQAEAEVLRGASSRALAEELLRRIATAKT